LPRYTERPTETEGVSWRYSLRTQAAALFVLIAIVFASLLAAMALAYQAADETQVGQDSLRGWQHRTLLIDTSALTIFTGVIQWNNAMLDKDLSRAQQKKDQVATDTATMNSLLTEIAALKLPSDTVAIRAGYAQAAAAVTSFGAKSVASQPRSDLEMQAASMAARTNWSASAAPMDPFITTKLRANDAIEIARTQYFTTLMITTGVLLALALLGLWFFQFRVILRPINSLSRIAGTLAAGQQATIKATDRRDEIGQLTDALSAWQEILGGALFRLRGQVADSATTLSVAAQELASATAEQNAAATATSTSMELLAKSSSSIADTIDRAAVKADQTRSSLELAQVDIRASGDRTLALAGQVNEVEGILQVINDIADQTNLLALNAAIEAARAGDAGRGFAVVADEVRRLAERTKTAAGDIAKLVEGAQAQSNDTVLALEKGVKQMERGLVMMKEMTDLNTQVQLSTQQQRAVTVEVMEAIEHIADGSRAVAITAQDLASSAASQGELAADLAGSGATVRQ
jgi:methyl-accepting chemotaxis protein